VRGASPADEGVRELLRAVRRRYGQSSEIENITIPTLGGANRTVVFDLVTGAARRRLVSRQESYAAEHTPFLSSMDQFRLTRVVFESGIAAPEPIFAYDVDDAMGNGYVAAFVGGETMPKKILQSPRLARARERLVAEVASSLARLHGIDVSKASFLEARDDSVDPIRAQRVRLDSYDEPHPAIDLALRWLERNRPSAGARRIVHGDLRVGNLIVAEDGLAAILDWECAHVGDPAEDLGWFCVRSWRFGKNDKPAGGIGTRRELLDAYEASGGRKVDVEEVRYWEIFGLARWAILNVMQAHGHVFGGRRSPAFAACGRNASMIEYDLLMTLCGHYD
jgi:aminoglycoside phosphotransferase (APT) family kinase protein